MNPLNRQWFYIHGLSATAESCYGSVGRSLQEHWHIVLCELDGHYEGSPAFMNIDAECEKIEDYVRDNHDGLSNTSSMVKIWRGSREPYPAKGAALLKEYIPTMTERVFPQMGHCQFLHEHSEEYAALLDQTMGSNER